MQLGGVLAMCLTPSTSLRDERVLFDCVSARTALREVFCVEPMAYTSPKWRKKSTSHLLSWPLLDLEKADFLTT